MNRTLFVLLSIFGLLAASGCGGSIASPADGGVGDVDGSDPDPTEIDLEECAESAFDSALAVFDGIESTYFVRQGGDDALDGTTPETAFATIGRGVEALSAGDTLTIGPGEYHESIAREGLGSDAADTVIQAAIPGTVILRGDLQAPAFAPLEGSDFVYVADFDPEVEVQMVNELDTLTPIERTVSLSALDVIPGFFYQDREAGKLYLSTSDRRPIEQHRYTVTVIGTHGIYLRDPVRVVIDGLVATGFNTATEVSHREGTHRAVWGMFIRDGRECVIRRAHVYMNGRGIGTNSGAEYAGNNLVERSLARGNHARAGNNQSDLGGITLIDPQQDVVRYSESFLNGEYGINIRGGGEDGQLESHQSFMRRNLAWGNGAEDFKIKTGYSSIHYAENCVALGTVSNTPNARHCLMGRGSSGFSDDNILLDQEADLDLAAEFADPDNHDYRLQATSRFRGAAPDGRDRGPFPYEADVYFVSPDGDDGGDGLSVAQAFRTVARAAEALAPGDTLYLSPGTYADDVALALSGSSDAPIAIRGRGTDPVIVEGAWSIANSRHVEIERLHFAGSVDVQESEFVSIERSSFSAPAIGLSARAVTGLRLMYNLFTGFGQAGVEITASERTTLAGNLFDNDGAVGVRVDDAAAVIYADYNGYRHDSIAWQVADGGCSLDDARPALETHSRRVVPEIDAASGRPEVRNRVDVAALGPYARPVGNYRDGRPEPELRLTKSPEVHSVSATTANIEWATSLPATTHFAWGPTPAMENEVGFPVLYAGSYSFTGLEPGTTYYFQIRSLSIPNIVDLQLDPVDVDSPVLEFTTASSDAAPATYYVAPDGDDANSGTSRADAFRTIQRAADAVNVGDTVLIDEGAYAERVVVRATGAPGAPITFRNVPGARVLLDGAGMLSQSIVVAAKQSLVFDGFFLDGHAYSNAFPTGPEARFDSWRGGQAGQFNLYRSRDITISRTLADGRGNDARDITAHDVENLLISNIVSVNKFGGALYLLHCPNVRVEHSVLLRPQINSVLLRNEADQPSIWDDNIFTDNLKKKADLNIQMLTADRSMTGMLMTNNVFQIRSFPVETREVFYSTMTLPEAASRGIVVDYLVTDPQYAGIVELIDGGEDPPSFPPDRFAGRLDLEFDFGLFFATDPEVVSRDIGLRPELFEGGLPN